MNKTDPIIKLSDLCNFIKENGIDSIRFTYDPEMDSISIYMVKNDTGMRRGICFSGLDDYLLGYILSMDITYLLDCVNEYNECHDKAVKTAEVLRNDTV